MGMKTDATCSQDNGIVPEGDKGFSEEGGMTMNCKAVKGLILTAGLAVLLLGSRQARAAGLLIAEGGLGGQLEIVEHDVQVVVNNGIAVTTVTQIFRNTENRAVEALYTFPVPKSASVSNFSMWINGKEMIGEVVEKKRARRIYQSYKQTKVDPGLLEQKDYRTFEMRIWPIAARARQKVQVTYYQELDIDHDQAVYVYPLASDTRPDVNARVNGNFRFDLKLKSEIPVSGMKSPSHSADFVIADHTTKHYQASLETAGGSLRRDLVVSYKLFRPKTGVDLITSRVKGEDGYFCLILTAGKELEKSVKGMDYVFVMDISGSMGQDGKLATTRKSVAAFVENLGGKDSFEIITFNVKPKSLFGELRKPNKDNLASASSLLQGLNARGGTSLVNSIAAAYPYAREGRTLNVILLSDGLTEGRERRGLMQIIGRRPNLSRVFCIGVGNDVNRPLLRDLAKSSGGLAAFISRGDDYQQQAQAFRRKLTRPMASNVKIELQGAKSYEIVPAEPGNLYYGQPIRIYGRYSAVGSVNCSITAEIAGHKFTKSSKLDLPAVDNENPEIDRMWAWHRMQELQAEGDRVGSRNMVAQKIVNLGETYSIASEFTSFIVLENDAEYRRWKIKRRNSGRLKRDRAAQAKLRDQLEALRTKLSSKIGPAPSALPARTAAPVAPKKTSSQPNSRPVARRPQTQRPARKTASRPSRRRGFDLPSMGRGGGAIDPCSSVIAGGLLMLVLAGKRSGRRKQD
jgi:Ca-activated chloride channel homolog